MKNITTTPFKTMLLLCALSFFIAGYASTDIDAQHSKLIKELDASYSNKEITEEQYEETKKDILREYKIYRAAHAPTNGGLEEFIWVEGETIKNPIYRRNIFNKMKWKYFK